MKSTVFVGYAPDADPTSEGIFTDCTGIVPSGKGFKAASSPVDAGVAALAAACRGAAVLRKTDETTRLIAGTAAKLYEAGASSWTDVSSAAGYTLAGDGRWSYAQFNDVSLAISKTEPLQASSSGAFAAVAGAPKANIVETVNEFVFLMDTNEAIYGDSTNRWWCAAQGNYTDWTPDINTNCYTGRLSSSPGKIRAGKRFGDNIVVYKDRAMYVGYFSGNQQGWIFKEVPGETGALSNEVVVNVGTPESPMHIFMGYNDFYVFDGSTPKPLGANIIKDTVYAELNRQYSNCSQALHDKRNNLIYFYYSSSSATPDKCVVYNYKKNQWGRDNRTIEAVVDYIAAGSTYDSMGTLYSTYDDISSGLNYNTAFFGINNQYPAIIDSTHKIKTLTGTSASSSITSEDIGDLDRYTTLTRVKPVFFTEPTTTTMTNYYKNELSDALTTDQTVSLSNNRFDVIRDARWHRVKFDFTGNLETSGMVSDLIPSGYE